ncbi:mobilization protein [Trinickia acidisoli]|uniref:mobilization protein n=1 Tax=Trinickia acidisoli TaxID=2767482 RepID=UPI001A8F372D|nr:mobilization protein [Trinickia acidisoli]
MTERKQTIDQRIALTVEKLKQLKAKKQLIEARHRATQAKQERAIDTRRKILLGAFMLEIMEQRGFTAATLEDGKFDRWLVRPDDRALFSLARY